MKKLLAAALAATMALCLFGCGGGQAEPEKTESEIAHDYLSSDAMTKFVEEASGNVSLMISAAQSGDIATAAKTEAIIEVMCDDLINYEPVPASLAEHHAKMAKSAECLKQAADYLSDAAVDKSIGDSVGVTNSVNKASAQISLSTMYTNEAKEIIDNLSAADLA